MASTSLGREFAVNKDRRAHLGPRALVSEPRDLAILDYRTITEPDLDSTIDLVATRAGNAHGLLTWFDAEVAEGLSYSNGPGHPELVYGQSFLPFPEPVRLEIGDVVSARIRARLSGGTYIWSWNTKVIDSRSAKVRHTFAQSNFKSRVVSRAAFDRAAGLLESGE